MTPRIKILTVLLAVMVIGSCSSRIEYTLSNSSVVAPTAININTATAAELEKLPYIGGKTAENIIKFREENGPIRRVEHLMQIRGISEERFLEIRHYLRTE